MLVLHLLGEARAGGNGIVRMVTDLANAQLDLGYDVTLVGNNATDNARLSAGVTAINWPVPCRFGLDRRNREVIRRQIEGRQSAVLHSHHLGPAVVARLAKATKTHVFTIHNRVRMRELLGSIIAARTVAVSKQIARSPLLVVVRRKVLTVLNGAYVMPACCTSGANDDCVRFLSIGGLTRRKGMDLLVGGAIRAIHDGAHIELDVVGTGPLEKELATMCTASQVSHRIRLHGYRENPFVIGSDVFVLSSRFDPCPMALIEAALLGLPVVCPPHGGMAEVASHARSAVWIEELSEVGVARALGHAAVIARKGAWNPERTKFLSAERMALDYDRVYRMSRRMGIW